jgi:hypothetical protein
MPLQLQRGTSPKLPLQVLPLRSAGGVSNFRCAAWKFGANLLGWLPRISGKIFKS